MSESGGGDIYIMLCGWELEPTGMKSSSTDSPPHRATTQPCSATSKLYPPFSPQLLFSPHTALLSHTRQVYAKNIFPKSSVVLSNFGTKAAIYCNIFSIIIMRHWLMLSCKVHYTYCTHCKCQLNPLIVTSMFSTPPIVFNTFPPLSPRHTQHLLPFTLCCVCLLPVIFSFLFTFKFRIRLNPGPDIVWEQLGFTVLLKDTFLLLMDTFTVPAIEWVTFLVAELLD